MIRAAVLLCFVHLIKTETIISDDNDCDSWRLPKSVLPANYDITLEIPTDPKATTFKGAIKIKLHCIQRTDTITLHSKDLNITTKSVTVRSDPRNNLHVIKAEADPIYEMIHLKLEPPAQQGSSLVLSIPEYFGQVQEEDGKGFFRNFETSDGNNRGREAYGTFFQPTYARRVFPCFDEPNMKATFKIRVVRSANFTSYSNMPLSTSSPVDGGRFLDVFEETPSMSTYTLGIAVSSVRNYPINVTTRTRVMLPEDNSDNVNLKLVYEVAKDALEEMEEYTGISYSLRKLDHLVLADYEFDGMEHWGLIIYPRRVFRTECALEKQDLIVTVLHEVAHQWFGNLVTMDWWCYFWLNEAIPTYLQYVIGKKILPEWEMGKQFIKESQYALEHDGGNFGVVLPLTNYEICNVYESFKSLTGVSYQKGASIIRMFEAISGGEDNFRNALRIYLKERMMKTSKPADLFDALNKVIGELPKNRLPKNLTFKDVATTWTEKPGCPQVTIIRDYASNRAHIRQERFYYDSTKKSQDKSTRWWIPLTWMTPSTADDSIHWFYEDETIYLNAAADDWILFNINATGFYRVNYDDQNWLLLAQALETSPQLFTIANRAQLLDDAVALTKAGRLNIDITLRLTRFLFNEKERVVWMTAERNLRELWEYDESFSSYFRTKAEIRRLVTKAYGMVSTTGKPVEYEETHLETMMRDILQDFACDIAVISCYRDRYLSWVPHWLQTMF